MPLEMRFFGKVAAILFLKEIIIALVEELPGANSQGDTLEEARSNLQEAVQLVLESNRALVEETPFPY
jgi:predicted RNase H-like HicB family nuclease